MLASLLALTFSPAQDFNAAALSRGVFLPYSGKYWQVEDTYLDPQKADSNFGGLGKLVAGDGKTILIRFDLSRAVPPNKRIKKASLSLTLYSGRTVKPKAVSQVMVPWGEGPLHTFSQNIAKPGEAEKPPTWSATFKHRRTGPDPIGWQVPGALGSNDTKPIPAATARVEEQQVVIEGLESVVQGMHERWYDNHGLALTFESAVEFESSQSPSGGRPTLNLEFEDAPAPTGSDLSVTYIERLPEYDRYGNDGAHVEKDGVGVMQNPGAADTKKWPADGEMVTYVAHVKNVGTAPSSRFFAKWMVAERAGARVDLPAIQPGQELAIKFEKPFKNIHTDHRLQPLGLRIEPQGPDALSSNNALDIQEGALSFGIWVEKGFYDKNPRFEDGMQEYFRLWNDQYMAHSRFSFAPMGSLERCRIQRINIVPDGSLSGPLSLPGGKATLAYDGECGFTAGTGSPIGFLNHLSRQLGLVDMDTMWIKTNEVAVPGFPGRDGYDAFYGLMGGGDTRNEANVPPRISIPFDPVFDPLLERVEAEPTNMYSATDVAALNSNLGKRRGYQGEFLYDTPSLTLLRAVDMAGRPLPYAELAFYQSKDSRIGGEPTLTLKADAGGSIVLPNRPTGEPGLFTTLTGHTLKNNPFGRIDTSGGNGVFLIKALHKGQTEWNWLKLWHLNDAVYRGNKGVAIIDVRFNMPVEELDPENIAKGRAVTSSSGADLAGLTDDALETSFDLPQANGSWVEVDLGRDRTIGELRLFSKDPFWERFDIAVYATGETPDRATIWSREIAWRWSARARMDPAPTGFSVAYRSLPQRIRYIRLIKKTDSPGAAKLTEIRVAAVKTN